MEALLKNFKAIIFDMDGVVVDSLAYWKTTENQMLSSFGIREEKTLQRQTESMSTREAITFWLSKFPQQSHNIDHIENSVIHQMIHLIKSNDCINTDVQKLINNLHAQSFLLGLATNSPSAIVEVVLNKAELETIFNAIVTADDVTMVKPHPEIFLKTAKKLKVSPKDCLVIEDSTYGIQAAKQAGMSVLLYQKGIYALQ